MRLGNRHLAAKINAMQEAANKEEMKAQVAPIKKETSSLSTDRGQGMQGRSPSDHRISSGRGGGPRDSEVTEDSKEVTVDSGSAAPNVASRNEPQSVVQTSVASESNGRSRVDDDSDLGVQVLASDARDGNGHGVELRPLSGSPNQVVHTFVTPSSEVDEESSNSLCSQGNLDRNGGCGGSSGGVGSSCSDSTVKSAQNSPEKQRSRQRRNRRHRIVINLDDKSRFTDEITV